MSIYEQGGRVSPAPFYHHPSSTDTAPSGSLSFMVGPQRAQVQQVNPGPPGSGKQPDDMHYIAKYREMKRKVKEIELDNDRLHLKCLKARKNIQRLRLERAILYESLSTMHVAETNVPSVPSTQFPGAHPYPSSDLVQGHQERNLFSRDDHARAHFDQPQMASEVVHHARSQHQHLANQELNPYPPPHRSYDNPLPIDYQQPGVPTLGVSHPVTKPRQRKLKVDTTGEKIQPFSLSTHREVRNGGSRTFPFVHEYSGVQEQVESIHAPSEYPSEIRFHQYEGLSERRPGNRSRRDVDRDTEKGAKHKRRPPQEVEKDRQRHPGSRSCSPTGPSSRGTYAFPIQNPFAIVEKESEPGPAQRNERDREPKATKSQHDVHFNESTPPYSAGSKSFGSREGDETSIRHEHIAEAEGEKTLGSAWQSPSVKKKRVQSQVDHKDRYVQESNEQDESNRTPRRPRSMDRANDHMFSLARVQEGEAMD